MTLEKSSNDKLKQIKHILEKFFYSTGTNVAFYNASRSPKYRKFREESERAIFKQISPFFEEKNVKAVQDRVPQDLQKITDVFLDVIVSTLLVSFVDLMDGSQIIDKFLLWAGNNGGQASFDKANIDLTFELYNPEVLSRLRDRRNYLINTVDDTTREWIARTIVSGTEKGISSYEIAQNLRDTGKDMSILRAKKIVETETANAMGVVELESIKRNGSKYKKWITSRDERVCEICMGNEQEGRIPVNEKFVSGVNSTPGHVFCRCYLEGTIPPDIDISSLWTGN